VQALSQRLEGYSGRQIAKFIISMRAAVFGKLAPKANLSVADQLLTWREWDRGSAAPTPTASSSPADQTRSKSQQIVDV
jgi:hypothetical protein